MVQNIGVFLPSVEADVPESQRRRRVREKEKREGGGSKELDREQATGTAPAERSVRHASKGKVNRRKKRTSFFLLGCGSRRGGGLCGMCESMKVKFTHATVETSRVPHHLVAVRNGRGEGGRTVDQVGQLFLADFAAVAVIFDRILVILVFDEVRDTSSQSAIVRIICRKRDIMSN